MKKMTTDEIREAYLNFFETKNHKRVASDSLVPADDPTLLFTGAGMNQFKKEFMGQVKDFRRATSSQKCMRTGDLDNVGKTPCHHTFFEMLGNFSFGDYFKEEAITWAWELITEVFKIPKDRLYISVYKDDNEAYDIWNKKIKIPKDRIYKLGDHTNFWPADAPKQGPNGPCGPCSEIFYDLGEEFGCGKPNCDIECECRRYVEVWNLVFTQFDRVGVDDLKPLPNKNIDTGMGLERIASVLQGVATNFEIDIFSPSIKAISKTLGKKYGEEKQTDSLINAIADHIRASVFAICDGVLPSNDQRGYVIRKLIRRALWYSQKLGYNKAYLYKIVPIVVDVMKNPYPELVNRQENISHIILAEEKRFIQTLGEGEILLEEQIRTLKKEKKNIISGDFLFKLYDTYGFPVDLTKEIAANQGFSVDEEGFEDLMQQQRKRARGKSQIADTIFVKEEVILEGISSEFIGYEQCEFETNLISILKDKKPVNSAAQGVECEMVLEKSPFYPGGGGQIADTGLLFKENAKAEVKDTYKKEDSIVLVVEIQQGEFARGDKVRALVDEGRRKNIMRNHTVTHLLHAVLTKVLGEHVHQAGSLVAADRLRFDFTHFEKVDPRVLSRIEDNVNELIRQDIPVTCEIMDIDKAKRSGAKALFGEKYEEKVRVLSIGDKSKELCGGTHVSRTGEIGYFKIISESSIASGVRRIEAVTAKAACEYSSKMQQIIDNLCLSLKVSAEELPDYIDQVLNKQKQMEKQIKQAKDKSLSSSLDSVTDSAVQVGETKIIRQSLKNADPGMLRKLIDQLKSKVKSGIFVLGAISEGKVHLVCGITKDLVDKGLKAPEIIKDAAAIAGGKSGGRPDMGFAGGKNVDSIDKALKKAEDTAVEMLQ